MKYSSSTSSDMSAPASRSRPAATRRSGPGSDGRSPRRAVSKARATRRRRSRRRGRPGRRPGGRPGRASSSSRVVDGDDLEAGGHQLEAQTVGDSLGRQGDDDCGTGHDMTPRRSGWVGQSPSGSWAVTSMPPSDSPVTRASKPGSAVIASRSETSAPWVTVKTNSPSGPEATPTGWTPGHAAEAALEAGDAGDADEAEHDDPGHDALGRWPGRRRPTRGRGGGPRPRRRWRRGRWRRRSPRRRRAAAASATASVSAGMSSTLTDPSARSRLPLRPSTSASPVKASASASAAAKSGAGVADASGAASPALGPGVRDEGQAGGARIERLDLWLRDRRGDVGQVGRVGHGLGHGRDAGRVFLGYEALEEVGHLGLERRPVAATCCDARFDDVGVRLDLALEGGLAGRDARLGLLADPGDLGLRPVADAGDIVVGAGGGGWRLPRSRPRGSPR